MYLIAPLSTRNQFGTFLTQKGLMGKAVEVGTHRGEFAKIILDTWPGELYCVDPWDNLPDYRHQAKYLWGGGQDRDADYKEAKNVLFPYVNRVTTVKLTSADAGPLFQQNSLDFVYIDGNHEPPHPVNDLDIWWPKVRKGGILAGHDIICPGPDGPENWGRYIQPAVFDFARAKNLKVHLIVEDGGLPWSYYIEKP